MNEGLLRVFPVPNFLHPPAVGLSIEDDHITLVQSLLPHAPAHAQQITLEPKVIDRGVVSSPERVLSALTKLRSVARNGNVALSLPVDAGFVVRMEIDGDVDDLREAIMLRIEEYVPANPAELVIDYEVVGFSSEKKWRVLVAAYPRDVVTTYEELLSKAGFTLVAAELSNHAIARCVVSGNKEDSTLIVDIGRFRSHATILVGHRPWLVSSVSLGWQQLIDTAARAAQMKPAEAERTIFSYGFSRLESKELYELMVPTSAALRDEVGKIIRFWDSHKERSWGKARGIERVALVGRGASIPGISTHMSSGFAARVRSVSPWDEGAYHAGQVPNIDRGASLSYAAASGAFKRAMARTW